MHIRHMSDQSKGMLLGLVAVIGFSLTPPATRLAIEHFDPTFVGLGRAVVAGGIAFIILMIMRVPLPEKRYVKNFLLVGACIALLFPLLSAWSLQQVSAAHAGVVLGILPLATAIAGSLRSGERPSFLFWLVSACGAATVIIYSLLKGAGQLQIADILLLLSVVVAAIGYSEGAYLTRRIGGWQVICWTMTISLPFLILPLVIIAVPMSFEVPASAWLGFLYLCLSSQLFSFFFWYRGLDLGGVARVSQLMLLMPFMTLFESALILHEQIDIYTYLFAAITVLMVAVSKRMSIVPAAIRSK